MFNDLAQYQNKELKNAISSVQVVSGLSKEGNTYYCIELHFINNYTKRLFLRNDEMFAWCNAFSLLETNSQQEMTLGDL